MKTAISVALCLAALSAVPAAVADSPASDGASRNSGNSTTSNRSVLDLSRTLNTNRSVDTRIDNGRSNAISNRLSLTRQYLMDQQYRSSDQRLNEQRAYSSGVGQGAGNQGAASGHSMSQGQGGVSVGSLVSESRGDSYAAQPGRPGNYWQFAPQSNELTISGDNYAPVSLSNINANGGSIHIGDVNKGNLYNSQIGNNQTGMQGGDTANNQSNSQQQKADSQTSSQDRVSN